MASAAPRALIAAGLSLSLGVAAAACPIAGEATHWIADYCMLTLQTDDEIVAGDCIARESLRSRGLRACERKRRYKRAMCETVVARDGRGGVNACLNDPAFAGSTVRNRGVGR